MIDAQVISVALVSIFTYFDKKFEAFTGLSNYLMTVVKMH